MYRIIKYILILNFCSSTDYQAYISFGTSVLCLLRHLLTLIKYVPIDDIIIISHATCVLTTKMLKSEYFHLKTDKFTMDLTIL